MGSLSTLDIVLVLGLAVCGLVVLFAAIFFVQDFRRELRYINMEIQRNDGRERDYWVRQKKKLWLSLIPFYRD